MKIEAALKKKIIKHYDWKVILIPMPAEERRSKKEKKYILFNWKRKLFITYSIDILVERAVDASDRFAIMVMAIMLKGECYLKLRK